MDQFIFDVSKNLKTQLDKLELISSVKGWTPSQKCAALLLSLPENIRVAIQKGQEWVKNLKAQTEPEAGKTFILLEDEIRKQIGIFRPLKDVAECMELERIKPGETVADYLYRLQSLIDSAVSIYTTAGQMLVLRRKILETVPIESRVVLQSQEGKDIYDLARMCQSLVEEHQEKPQNFAFVGDESALERRISRDGVPEIIHSDDGSEIIDRIISSLDPIDIKKSFITKMECSIK